jgi:peptide deformylase
MVVRETVDRRVIKNKMIYTMRAHRKRTAPRLCTVPAFEAWLRQPTRPVQQVGPDIRAAINLLMEEVKRQRGYGIAANQLGFPWRICVVAPPDAHPRVMINPRITKRSPDECVMTEGCLSIPGKIALGVPRAVQVTCVYQDPRGHAHRLTAEGLLARIIQHEVDHLDGVLLLDRVPHPDHWRDAE